MRCLLVIAAVVCLTAMPAAGQRTGEAIGRLQAQRNDDLLRGQRLRQDAGDAAREVERLRGELARLSSQEPAEDFGLAAQRARLAELNQREAELLTVSGRERGRLSRLLGALQLLRRDPPPALLVSPGSATDAVRAAILMRAVTPELERRAARVAARQRELARLRRQTVLQSEALITSESTALDRRAEVEQRIAEQGALSALLSGEAAEAEAAARAAGLRIRSLGGVVRSVPDVDSAPGEAAALTLPSSLTPPVTGEVIGRFRAGSPGWTWRTAPGAVVVAPIAGVVDYAGGLEGWGQVVILRPASGWRIVIAGLQTSDTRTGLRVSRDQTIGRMAPRPARPDLYLEVRRLDRPVDPARHIR